MKSNIYSKLHALSDRIPMFAYIGLTQQNLILPFYHTVTNVPKPHLKHLSCYRTKFDFEKDVCFFKKHFNSIPISDIDLKIKSPSFHITFDDGLSDIMTEAVPFLLANKIHATFFVNSDFIDNNRMFFRHKTSVLIDYMQKRKPLEETARFLNLQLKEVIPYLEKLNFENEAHIDLIAHNISIDFKEYLKKHKPYLTSIQLLQLIEMGFTIGNHGKNHPNFDEIDLNEQINEVVSGSKFLKELPFGIKENYFSFPFGSDNRSKEFYAFLYKKNKVNYSFGVSGLKRDVQKKHFHRIVMEYEGIQGDRIIKFEYFYYMVKVFFNKNTIKRVGDD
jgi:peptidoglycan/xylan/chitin deacetylase (PgdA/CDA1 family)